MIAGLKGGRVVLVFARALVEGWGLITVLPYGAFEVLPCRGVVSAHLRQLGHGGASMDLNHLAGLSLRNVEPTRESAEGLKPLLLWKIFLFSSSRLSMNLCHLWRATTSISESAAECDTNSGSR